MRAVYISEFGGPDVLEIREVPDPPPPGEGDVLVRVLYAGLNRADILQRQGLYPPPAGTDPRIPGLEFAGRIYETGRGVSGLEKNDRVFGITSGAAQAGYLVVDQRLVAHSPAALDSWDAAAVPEAYVTAHDALVTQAGLASGETVVIHAVASGVGIAATQIARNAGARVIGTSRTPAKLERFLEPGSSPILSVDHAIDTSGGADFANKVLEITDGRGADVILDLVGGAYFPEDLRCAAERGRIMLVGLMAGRKAEFDMGIALSKRLTIRGPVLRSRTVEEKGEAMEGFRREVVPGISHGGPFFPEVDRYFDLQDVAKAHEYLGSDQSFGKVVLNLS